MAGAAGEPREGRAWPVLAFVLSALTAAAVAREVVGSPTDTILCNYVHPDCLSNQWLMVWVADQLAHFRGILHNDAYYWPVGDAPWLAGNGSEGFAMLPWHLLLPWPLSANVHLLLVLALNGMAAYALARAAGASAPAALTAAPAGVTLVFCIQEMAAGRFTQVSVCWLGFFLAAWLRFLDDASWRRGLLAAGTLALTCLFYWYYGFFGVMAGALLLLARLARRSPLAEGAEGLGIASLGGFALAFLGLAAPLLWVFLANWATIPGTAEATFPHPESVADSTWPAVPFLEGGGRHAGRDLAFTTCLFALVGLGLAKERWKAGGLALVAVGFTLLMAGTLVPHGPYELIYGLAGPLRRFWWPYRHVVVLNLALIALAARGVDGLGRWRRWAAVPLALLVPVQLELQGAPWHAQFSKAEVPAPFYREVAALPGEVLLEPPLSPQVASAQSQLLYQLDHHKKLLAGHAMWVKRVRPPAWDELLESNSFLDEMLRLERGKLDGSFRFEARDLAALRERGLGVVVVNWEYFPKPLQGLTRAYEEVFTALFGPAAVEGPRARAWSLAGWDGRSEVSFTAWEWPKGVKPGGPTLAIQAPRWPSLSFYVPVVEPGAGWRRPEDPPSK